MTNNKTYTIFTVRLASKLQDMGFKLVGTGINFQQPKYKVFFFEDSEALRDALKEDLRNAKL